MQGPEKNSYKEFDNEKKFLRLENSPPPHNFSNGPSLMVINNHDIFHVLSMLIHSAEVGRILILKRMWSP